MIRYDVAAISKTSVLLMTYKQEFWCEVWWSKINF